MSTAVSIDRGSRSHEPGKLNEKSATDRTEEINAALSMLNTQWDLRLPIPTPSDSPSTRPKSVEGRCAFFVKILCYKNRLHLATTSFNDQAKILYQGWIHKPRAERGYLPPKTRDRSHQVTNTERAQLVQCLLNILEAERSQIPPTPSQLVASNRKAKGLDDSPIATSLPKKTNKKRSSADGFEDVGTSSKKPKAPDVGTGCNPSTNLMAPPKSAPPPNRVQHQQQFDPDISFTSTRSGTSIFTAPSLRHHESTQLTIPDNEYQIPTQPNTRPPSPGYIHPPSSDYGSSSFDQHVRESFDAGHCVDIEAEMFPDCLTSLFSLNGAGMNSLPFAVAYEVTRVCLFAEIPVNHLGMSNSIDFRDYTSFWSHLEAHPLLQGKNLPQQCNQEIWKIAVDNFSHRSQAVLFSGKIIYSTKNSSLFQLCLEPMKLDKSHRLGRRFGNDRFLEIDFPAIFGRKVQDSLRKLGDNPQHQIVSWLVKGMHELLNRTWKPFHVKPNDKRGRRAENTDELYDTAHRIFFFAVDGAGFQQNANPSFQGIPRNHGRLSVSQLLDYVRPTALNDLEKYLKLFARTDLVVSKNTPTIVLNYNADPLYSQIIYKQDIRFNGEVMTDGAGQISYNLALEVAKALGLSFVPSGFQGRIGEAKGFWSVDYSDNSGRKWLSIYESQRKWKPRPYEDPEASHESNRTFEVLRYSSPLKAADLNLQLLPLLQERALDPKEMELAIKGLLQEGLQRCLDNLQIAMTDPMSLRVWLKDYLGLGGDRLKEGSVPYRAGLPTSIEERIIMMLDAGFNPNMLSILKDLARRIFKTNCDDLMKRLNITVSKSTYCYMIPDFWGVLEADEVYLDFSRFTDDSSEFATSNVLLNGVEVLVARSPAHYVSDIQKVKAVHRVELVGLKDVIVFSTKANPSLAAKLSGGDYDGDIAWVCWEPSITNNFENAEVPCVPDLVKEGLVRKNSTTYKDLVQGKIDPTSEFLVEAFQFNMQLKMLGRCTNFKEELCYTMRTVDSVEANYMSTLLSCLVDQAKQGYMFTEKEWDEFKKRKIKRTVRQQSYKTDHIDRKSDFITDQLMATAHDLVNESLKAFNENTSKTSPWDPDLVKYYNWARDQPGADWKCLLNNLDIDLKNLISSWRKSSFGRMASFERKALSGAREDKSHSDFLIHIDKTHREYIKIVPRLDPSHQGSPLPQSLRPDYRPEGLTEWALLRASAFFAFYRRRKDPPDFVWHIAGRDFARLKATHNEQSQNHTVVPRMYAMMRPDGPFVKKFRSMRETQSNVGDENMSVVNAEELDYFSD